MLVSISRFHSARRFGASGALVAIVVTAPAAAETVRDSAQLDAATLTVVRAEGTAECAGARALSERLSPLVEPAPKDAAPLEINVAVERTEGEWVAEVVVRGGSEGVRRLRAPGPGCAELERRLTALLAIVLDRSGTEARAPAPVKAAEAAPAAPAAAKPAAPPASNPAPPAPKPAPRAPEPAADAGTDQQRTPGGAFGFSVAASAGGGITAGVAGKPLTWFFASLAIERGRWALVLSGVNTLDSNEALAPGSVEVSWTGGMARPCLLALEAGSTFRLWGCAALMAASLRGEAHDYTIANHTEHRPYYAVGGGALGTIKLETLLFVELEATLLAPVQPESFSIRGAGVAFETPGIGGWFGASLGVRVW